MDPHTTAPVTSVAEHPGQSDRRHGVRTPTILSLLYSGMDSGQMLMGDGVVTDLSSSGIGISGDRSVTPGMEVALFVDLPGVEEPPRSGGATVHCPEPGLLGRGTSIWSGAGDPEVGGEESSGILLVGLRHPLRP